MFGRVHHVAYIVADMDKAVEFFSREFELKLQRRWSNERVGTKYGIFRAGDSFIELLEPFSPASAHWEAARERGGFFLDHVAYGVHNLDEVARSLQERGMTFRKGGPHMAPTGWRVVNIDPRSTLGIYVQLVDLDHEEPEAR